MSALNVGNPAKAGLFFTGRFTVLLLLSVVIYGLAELLAFIIVIYDAIEKCSFININFLKFFPSCVFLVMPFLILDIFLYLFYMAFRECQNPVSVLPI